MITLCVGIPVLHYDQPADAEIRNLWLKHRSETDSLVRISVIVCAKSIEYYPPLATGEASDVLHLILQSPHHTGIYGAMNQILGQCVSSYICFMGLGDYFPRLGEIAAHMNSKADLDVSAFIVCPSLIDYAKSLFFPCASELCHQQIIYKATHNILYDDALSVNSDHLFNLKYFSRERKGRISRVHSPFYIKPGGIGQSKEDPFYYYYRQCMPILGPFMAKIILHKAVSRLRACLKRNIRFRRFTSRSRYLVFVISNRAEHLLRCLQSVELSFRQLPSGQQRRIELYVLFDDRESTFEYNLSDYIDPSLLSEIKFFLLSTTTIAGLNPGRSELRNHLYSLSNPLPEDVLVFLDGDVAISRSVLSEVINKGSEMPWGQFPVLYLDENASTEYLDLREYRSLPRFQPRWNDLAKAMLRLLKKRSIVFVRMFLGPKASKLFIPRYSPTLQSGVFFINSQVFDHVNRFESLHDSSSSWGTEDSYLGYKLYRENLLPLLLGMRNLSFHIYHPMVDSLTREQSRKMLQQLY
jgi:hypothetical protein